VVFVCVCVCVLLIVVSIAFYDTVGKCRSLEPTNCCTYGYLWIFFPPNELVWSGVWVLKCDVHCVNEIHPP
jgi:hypothetical protein